MSTSFAIMTIIEFIACVLLIWGFAHEEKFIRFEYNIKRIVIGNIRRAIRVRNHKKRIAKGEHLRLHTPSRENKIVNVDFTVA